MQFRSLQDNTKRRMTEQFSFKCSPGKNENKEKKSNKKKRLRESKTKSKKDEESMRTNNPIIQKRINDNLTSFEGKSLGDILSNAKNNSPFKNRQKTDNKEHTVQGLTSSMQKRNILKEREIENLKAFGGAGLDEVFSNSVKAHTK